MVEYMCNYKWEADVDCKRPKLLSYRSEAVVLSHQQVRQQEVSCPRTMVQWWASNHWPTNCRANLHKMAVNVYSVFRSISNTNWTLLPLLKLLKADCNSKTMQKINSIVHNFCSLTDPVEIPQAESKSMGESPHRALKTDENQEELHKKAMARLSYDRWNGVWSPSARMFVFYLTLPWSCCDLTSFLWEQKPT